MHDRRRPLHPQRIKMSTTVRCGTRRPSLTDSCTRPSARFVTATRRRAHEKNFRNDTEDLRLPSDLSGSAHVSSARHRAAAAHRHQRMTRRLAQREATTRGDRDDRRQVPGGGRRAERCSSAGERTSPRCGDARCSEHTAAGSPRAAATRAAPSPGARGGAHRRTAAGSAGTNAACAPGTRPRRRRKRD